MGAEAYARRGLGLGDPPLSVADPQIEYMFKPSSSYHRFGNFISYNSYSMRSKEFPAHKRDPREFRIMVMGDSVVNGGVLTDQEELATFLLERQLSHQLHRPVTVGNISAGSWGPPNMLAYARRFGFFDANVVIIVLSSHDAADVPSFQPVVGVDPDFPSHSPSLAIVEAATRYLPRYLPFLRPSTSATTLPSPVAHEQNAHRALADLRSLILLAKQKSRVILVQHWEQAELHALEPQGHARIRSVGRACGVSIIQLGPAFLASLQSGNSPYRDNIHPNALGQSILAQRLFQATLPILISHRSST